LKADFSYRFHFINLIISIRIRIPQFIYDGTSDEPSAAPLAQLDLSKRKDSKFMEFISPYFYSEKRRFEGHEQL